MKKAFLCQLRVPCNMRQYTGVSWSTESLLPSLDRYKPLLIGIFAIRMLKYIPAEISGRDECMILQSGPTGTDSPSSVLPGYHGDSSTALTDRSGIR